MNMLCYVKFVFKITNPVPLLTERTGKTSHTRRYLISVMDENIYMQYFFNGSSH